MDIEQSQTAVHKAELFFNELIRDYPVTDCFDAIDKMKYILREQIKVEIGDHEKEIALYHSLLEALK